MSLSTFALLTAFASCALGQNMFDARAYGASGRKQDDARPALQKAIDACGSAGGGTVYVPPGEYTSGQLRLRSGVRLYLEAGATLYASLDAQQFDPAPKSALLYGEDLSNIAIDGRGTIDGQAAYEWRVNDFTDYYILSNQRRMHASGKPLLRPFPIGLQNPAVFPRIVLLLRCVDVRISGLKFLRSRSWTINPYACQRVIIDGIYIYSSLKEAVWADGIDPDGCQDVRISNSTIETGDDAIVFYSADIWGPALPTENVTVTNCRLSSASSALKFCDGNANAIRRVTVDNVVITNSNRGLAFMVFDGGIVEDVVISNVTIDTRRFDWFWWGEGDPIHFNIKRRSEVDERKRTNEPPPGVIRNVSIRNIIAHGTGTSSINGHPESYLDDIRLDGIRLFVTHDPTAPYEDTRTAMDVRHARRLAMKDVEIRWERPASSTWTTTLALEDVRDAILDGVEVQPVPASTGSAVMIRNVDNVLLRNCDVSTLEIKGERTRKIRLLDTDAPIAISPEVKEGSVKRSRTVEQHQPIQ